MTIVIRVLGIASGFPFESAGQYLRSADVDAYDGRGIADFTRDAKQAMHFATYEAAVAFWQRQSTRRPLRDDGQPNRPLTAYHIEIETLP